MEDMNKNADAEKKAAPRRYRVLRFCLKALAVLCLCLCVLAGGLFAFLRTDTGAQFVRETAVSLFEQNDIVGLKLEIDDLKGPLPFTLTAKGVRMRDMQGLWLDVGFLHAELDALDLLTGLLRGTLYIHGRSAVVHDAHMIRIPVFPPSEESEPPAPDTGPKPYTLLPEWLRIAVDDIDVHRAHVEPEVSAIGVYGHVRGTARLEASHGDTRLGVACAFPENRAKLRDNIDALVPGKVPPEWPFPAVVSEGSTVVDAQAAATGAKKAPPAEFPDAEPLTVEGSLRLVWEGARFGLTFEATDNAFVQRYAPMAGTARLRLAAHYAMPVVPPVPGQALALDSQLDAHFSGPLLPKDGRNVNLRLYSSYDGNRFSIGPIRLESPDEDTQLRILAAGGLADEGNGVVINAEAKDIGPLLSLAGSGAAAPAAGDVRLCVYDASGEGWWHGMLDADEDFTRKTLACTRKKGKENTETAAPQPQKEEAALHARQEDADRRVYVDFASEQLRLPNGSIIKPALRLEGSGTGNSYLTPLLPASMSGSFSMTADNVLSAGRLDNSFAWKADIGVEGKEEFALDRISISLPGIDVRGGLRTLAEKDRLLGIPLLEGSVKTNISDLKTVSALAGLPPDFLHIAKLESQAQFKAHDRVQDAALSTDIREVRNASFSLSSVSLKLASPDIYALIQSLTSPDMQSAADSGLLTAKLRTGGGRADMAAWNAAEIDVHANASDIVFSAAVRGETQLKTSGRFNTKKQALAVNDFSFRLPPLHLDMRLQKATECTFAPNFRLAETVIALSPAGTLSVSGELTDKEMRIAARTAKIPLELARKISGIAEIPDADINSEFDLKGTMDSPSGRFSFSLDNIRSSSTKGITATAGLPQAVHLKGRIQGSGGRGKLEAALGIEGWSITKDGDFTCTAEVPLLFSPAPAPDMDSPLKAKLFWRGNTEPVWNFVPLPGSRLSGRAQLQASVSGTMKQPRAEVDVFLADALFTDKISGVKLRNINLETRYKTHGESVLRLSANDTRKGTMAVSGKLSPRSAQNPFDFTGMRISARGVIDRLRPLHRDDLSLQLSGELSVDGDMQAMKVNGDISLDEVIYRILKLGGASVTELTDVARVKSYDDWRRTQAQQSEKPEGAGPELNLRVHAPGKIFIRGKGLQSEWKADLRIAGHATAPSVVGNVAPVRGTFDILGKQFAFSEGSIRFTGAWPPLPSLDLGLTYQAQNIIAEITVKGSAKKPKLGLTSKPVLPQDEVMAQILFGKGAADLDRYQLIQAANTARILVSNDAMALDVLGKTRDMLGFEVLRVGSSKSSTTKRAPTDASMQGKTQNDDDSAPTLEAGKYLFDNVYVGVEQSTSPREGTAVRVDVDVLPNVSVSGRSSNVSSNVGVNWKMDY